MRHTAERLATQGVAVYPIAQLDKNLTPETVREALPLFADTTGGRVTYTMNDPMEALKTTALDQRPIALSRKHSQGGRNSSAQK